GGGHGVAGPALKERTRDEEWGAGADCHGESGSAHCFEREGLCGLSLTVKPTPWPRQGNAHVPQDEGGPGQSRQYGEQQNTHRQGTRPYTQGKDAPEAQDGTGIPSGRLPPCPHTPGGSGSHTHVLPLSLRTA